MLLVFVIILLIVFILSVKFKFIIKIKNNKHCICLDIYLFKKIKIYSVVIDDNKKKKRAEHKHGKNTKYNNFFIEIIRKGKYQLECFYFKADVCTTDPVLTAYFVAAISSFIGIGVKLLKFNVNSKNFHFKINPIYNNKKILNIKLKCIISISLVHIITIFLGNRKNNFLGEQRTWDKKLHVILGCSKKRLE